MAADVEKDMDVDDCVFDDTAFVSAGWSTVGVHAVVIFRISRRVFGDIVSGAASMEKPVLKSFVSQILNEVEHN